MEENVNEVLGISKANTERANEGIVVNESSENIHSASKGLEDAATICRCFMWIGIIMTFIAAIVYLNYSNDLKSYYDDEKIEAAQMCAIASSCFVYGIVETISCFISSKILDGIGIIAKAAEQYLSAHHGSRVTK